MTTEETKKNVFQTPKPAELKAEAKADPIQEREPAPDETADPIVDSDADEALDYETGRGAAAEMANSPVVKANISGH